jgi:hypothetical protein
LECTIPFALKADFLLKAGFNRIVRIHDVIIYGENKEMKFVHEKDIGAFTLIQYFVSDMACKK